MSESRPAATHWIAFLNPAVRLDSEDKAHDALRFAAVMMAVQALVALAPVAWTATHIAQTRAYIAAKSAAAMAAQPAGNAEIAKHIPDWAIQGSITFGLVIAALYLAAAAVQWFRRTGWIPLVFAVFSALGVFGFVRGLLRATHDGPPTPLALTILSGVVSLLSLGAYITAVRAKRHLVGEAEGEA